VKRREALQRDDGATAQEAWIRVIKCKHGAFKQKQQKISIIFEML
jgi:hypothetical protein